MADEPIYFESPEAFRAWLEEHHADRDELSVGFWRVATGKPSMTWSESVDQALCFGWIDGVRHKVDDERYTMRFTPRRPGSNWSAVNVRKVAELTEKGLMRPAGVAAFEARTDAKTAVYSYEEERRNAAFDSSQEKQFKADAGAWAFFSAQPPGYRRTATYWVVSAKRADTRQRRLERLIAESAAGRRIYPSA